MKRTVLGLLVCGFVGLGAALPASAQDVDRIAGTTNPGGGYKAPEGVKVVAPGALVFASFDRNFDGRISAEEITAQVKALVAELGATGPGDMGKVMGAAKAKFAGNADMGLVSAAVKQALAR